MYILWSIPLRRRDIADTSVVSKKHEKSQKAGWQVPLRIDNRLKPADNRKKCFEIPRSCDILSNDYPAGRPANAEYSIF